MPSTNEVTSLPLTNDSTSPEFIEDIPSVKDLQNNQVLRESFLVYLNSIIPRASSVMRIEFLLTHVLRCWKKNLATDKEDQVPKRLAHVLREYYGKEGFGMKSLRGDDLGQALCLQRACATAGFNMFLAHFGRIVFERAIVCWSQYRQTFHETVYPNHSSNNNSLELHNHDIRDERYDQDIEFESEDEYSPRPFAQYIRQSAYLTDSEYRRGWMEEVQCELSEMARVYDTDGNNVEYPSWNVQESDFLEPLDIEDAVPDNWKYVKEGAKECHYRTIIVLAPKEPKSSIVDQTHEICSRESEMLIRKGPKCLSVNKTKRARNTMPRQTHTL